MRISYLESALLKVRNKIENFTFYIIVINNLMSLEKRKDVVLNEKKLEKLEVYLHKNRLISLLAGT